MSPQPDGIPTTEIAFIEQERIPVGCVPSAAVAVTGGSPHTPGSRSPPEQAAPQARSPSTSPLGVDLEKPPPPRPDPLNFPPGGGPGNLQGMLGYSSPETCCKACWDTTPPSVNRITDSCKNITFPQLRLRAVMTKYHSYVPATFHTFWEKVIREPLR